jgi:hypothetical protein
MNSAQNPYAPGAGTPPPELAGRDALCETVRVALERIRAGRAAKGVLFTGLRGVGKTVLLNKMRADADADGIQTLFVEVPEERSLPAILCPELRLALLRLSRVARAGDLAKRALRALAGFAKALKMTFADIEVGLDFDPEPGLADNGNLEHDLQVLLETSALAAQQAQTALVLFMDGLQYIPKYQLAPLLRALHLTAQRSLPLLLVGAGLPTLVAQVGLAKTYVERMFDFLHLGPLSPAAARDALEKPAEAQGVRYEPDALEQILRATECYPYFLQEWGKHAWDVAAGSPITVTDVAAATKIVTAALDEGFFRVRFNRLTTQECRYLRAMAEFGGAPVASGEIAAKLGRAVTAFAPTRSQLMSKGMIWSPKHGETAFTVPMFDQFMRRAMPVFDPNSTIGSGRISKKL